MIKQLGKDLLLYGGADLIFKITAFSVFPIYTHHFSVKEFGLYTLLTVSASLIGVFINFGVNNAVQRYYWDPNTHTSQQSIIVSTGLAQLILFGLPFLFISSLLFHFHKDSILNRYGIDWTLISITLATILPDQIVQYCLDTVRLHFKPLRFMAISFTKNLFGVFLGLYFILFLNQGLVGLFIGPLIGSIVALPLGLWFIKKDLTLRLNRNVAKKLFNYGFPFVFTGIAYWLFGSLDRWMLAELSNLPEVGIYSIAFKFAAIIGFINIAFGQAWSPFAIKLMRDEEDYRNSYSRIFSLWFFSLSIIGFLISIFSKEILQLLTPFEYWKANKVMSVVIASSVLFGTTQITALGISIEKKTSLLTFGAIITAAVNLVLNYLLIPRYGALGAAIATLFANIVLTSFFLFWTQKLHTIPLEYNKLIYSCSIVIVSIFIPAWLDSYKLTPLVIGVKVITILSVLAFAFVVGIIERRMFGLINHFTNRNAKSSYYGR